MRLDLATFLFQVLNFLVLLWLLRRFLYRPVQKIIAARQAATDKIIADAKAEKASAEALRQDLERQKSALAKEREAVLSKARDAAQAERAAILDQARKDADASQAAGRKALESERAQVVRTLESDAARLGVSMTRRLLEEERSFETAQAGMLDLLCHDLGALAPDARQRVAESMSVTPPEVITARPLDAAAQADLSARLSEALGSPMSPVFHDDPALIAGVELHLPFTVLKRAWSDDLQRIGTELAHDEHQRLG
jgi:F-type H+-transporting ATPase subunit b